MLGHQLVVHAVDKNYKAVDFHNPVGACSMDPFPKPYGMAVPAATDP